VLRQRLAPVQSFEPFSPRSSMPNFVSRLSQRIKDHSPLCVGIDPSAAILDACGLPDSAAGALEFGKRVLNAARFELAIIKPQAAFFERFGSPGVAAMEELTALARAREVLVLLDGKRGDIDTTGAAYAAGYFAPSTPLRVDAVTTHPYLGLGALHPFIDFAVEHDGAVFVVVRSSNPEGMQLQTARLATGETVAQSLCRQIGELNRKHADGGLGPVGAVVGATCEDASATVADLPTAFILAPGVGAQGATMRDVLLRMSAARSRILPSVSRAILANGAAEADLRTGIRALQEQARQLL
jgi:orotidine-5'-phosphate decarboxylase